MSIGSNRSWDGDLLRLTPGQLLRDRSYWLRHQRQAGLIVLFFVATLAAQVFLGIIDLRNLAFAGGYPGFCTLSIQLVTIWFGVRALWHGLRLIARLDVETAVATEVFKNAEKVRDRIQGGREVFELAKVPTLWP